MATEPAGVPDDDGDPVEAGTVAGITAVVGDAPSGVVSVPAVELQAASASTVRAAVQRAVLMIHRSASVPLF
jgi:hypothetical protein